MTTISHQTSGVSLDRDDYYRGPYPNKSTQKVVVVARSVSRSRSRSRSVDRIVVTKRNRSIDRVRGRSRSIDRIVVRTRSPVRGRSVSRVIVRQRYPSHHSMVVRKRSPSIDRVVVRRGSSLDRLAVRTRSPYRSFSAQRGVSAVTTTTRYATNALHPTHHHYHHHHHHRSGNRHRYHHHHRSGSADVNIVRIDNNSASYTRVHVDRICPETLRYFHIPWEWESVRSLCSCFFYWIATNSTLPQHDSDYIIIKRSCSQLELEDLCRHTRSIRITKTSVSGGRGPHRDEHYDTTITKRTTVMKKGGGTNWWGRAVTH
jgi:hypothetical protein